MKISQFHVCNSLISRIFLIFRITQFFFQFSQYLEISLKLFNFVGSFSSIFYSFYNLWAKIPDHSCDLLGNLSDILGTVNTINSVVWYLTVVLYISIKKNHVKFESPLIYSFAWEDTLSIATVAHKYSSSYSSKLLPIHSLFLTHLANSSYLYTFYRYLI